MADESEPYIIIHPRRQKNEKQLPENGILLVNPSEANECLRQLKESGGQTRFIFNSGMVVDRNEKYFAAGPAIGAPMAVLTLEKLIALGAKRVILFGWCGAISETLHVGDTIVPNEALSGEGTSRYYSSNSVSVPDLNCSKQLAQVFSKNDFRVHKGCVWSTDAVYREDKRMLKQLRINKGVVAVDMEFSALCAVAKFRKIEFAAVLTVSDELWGKSWRPGFNKHFFIEQKQKALQLLLDHLQNFKEN